MSRVGNKPIQIPDKVKVNVDGQNVAVEGPKGKLAHMIRPEINVKIEEKNIVLSRKKDDREDRAYHGLSRSLLQNMVIGVTDGFQKKLQIQGVGFRAALQGKKLNLSLGFSHPVHFEVPDDIKVQVKDQTEITVEGIDKQRVGAVAADIRRYYPPEPYKGKGVRYVGENVRRKEGKTAQSK